MILLVLLVLASLAFLVLGFNWLFGSGRSIGPAPEPTALPSPTRAPAAATATTGPQPTATRPAATATSVPATATAAPAASPTAAATATRALPTIPPTAPPVPTKPAAGRVAVPPMVGISFSDAQALAQSRNLILDAVNGEDPRQRDGTVLDQMPKAGETVAEKSVVRVVVNRLQGAQVTVPNVQGMDEDEARKALERADFKVKVERERGGRKGVVNDQSPQPNVKVAPGTQVTIVIGS